MSKHFIPHFDELEKTIALGGVHMEAKVACELRFGDESVPVHVVTLGNPDPAVPAVGFFGGFHGLERIGAEVVLAYLQNLASRLKWDDGLHHMLENIRMVFMPLVNPVGIGRGTRANLNGVDLMRNAPLDAVEPVPWMLGGQRISARLPWYRGIEGAPMEIENRAVADVVNRELLSHRFSLSVDCHSGFGTIDRLWFPYAHTRVPIGHLAEMHALKETLQETFCNYRYVFEPQSSQYLTHGDVWDHLYRQSLEADSARIFLPLTLEMGSWIWVKKNPRQLFSRHGIFNPLIEHRQQRVLRRHLPLLDFFARAARSHAHWIPHADARANHREQALAHWYPDIPGSMDARR